MSIPPVTDSLEQRITALAHDAVSDLDLFVVEVEVKGFQGSRVVSVFVDSETGAGADDLARLSRSLGFVLEAEDVVKGRYRLDVSTPGAERSLVDARQYPRHVGRDLRVTFEAGQDQLITAQGELTATDDDGITLDGHDEPISYDSIREARVQLPW